MVIIAVFGELIGLEELREPVGESRRVFNFIFAENVQ